MRNKMWTIYLELVKFETKNSADLHALGYEEF